MVNFGKQKMILAAEFLHRRIFGEEMSEEMRKFLGHLSWSFFGGIIAAGIMFVVNILAGRILGIVEFGKYNYVISLASAATFFFLLGNNVSSIRHASDRKYENERGKFLGAFLFLTLVQSIIFLFFVLVLKSFILDTFKIDSNFFYPVILLSFILATKELFDSFARSMEFFKKQSFAKIIDASLVFLVFIFFYLILNFKSNYIYYLISLSMGSIFSIIFLFLIVRRYINIFSKKEIKAIFHYNKFLIIGGLSGFIISLDKFFIGNYMGFENLGLYSAYYASSYLIISNLGILFTNIFWPAIVKNKESLKIVTNKITLVFFRYFPIWLIINCVSISIFIGLYGREYPFNLILVLLFAVSSLLNICFYIFMSILNVEKIYYSVIITMVVYLLMIASIILFKNIYLYLLFQILIYLICVILIKKLINCKIH